MKKKMGAILFVAAILFIGCGGRKAKEYEAIVEDYARLILRQDGDSAEYDGALAAVGAYLGQPDEAMRQEAKEVVLDVIGRMEQAQNEQEAYTLEADFSELLKRYGIEPEEYVAFADGRKQALQDYQTTLASFEAYFRYEEDDAVREAFAKEYELAKDMQDILKCYRYCGIQYWFAGWDGAGAACVRENVLDKLISFSAEQEGWQEERAAVERKMAFYLDELEERKEEYAKRSGERRQVFSRMQTEQKEAAAVEKIVSDMTLEEKIAQMFLITPEALTGQKSVTAAGTETEEAYARCPVGGLIYFAGNIQSEEQVKQMTAAQQEIAKKRIGLPLFLGVDEEGGSVARIANDSPIAVAHFPNMAQIGALEDAEERAKELGAAIGAYVSRLGFNLDFAPVADVLTNPENTVVRERSFGADPQKTATLAVAVAKGLEAQGVYSCMKHFPGHGATAEDSHQGFASTDKTLAQLREAELIPFQKGMEAGVSFLMAGHISAPNVTGDDAPATLSGVMLTDILRTEMQFDGIIVTDAMNMGAISHAYSAAQAAEFAVSAGVDMILMPSDFKEAYEGLLEAVRDGRITQERIEDSVRRIVRRKLSLSGVRQAG